MYANTVVLIGDRFDPAMIKADDLFGGAVDAGPTLVGPLAQYSYGSSRCRFGLNPSRIDLGVLSPDIMPEELQTAAMDVASALDAIRVAVTVTGIGLNCDVALPREGGVALSNQMANLELMKTITGASTPQATTVASYERGELRYNVRIEPEVQSQGRNLFVAVNGHQNVGPNDLVRPTLAQFPAFREYVKELHARIDHSLA